jgi:hypothetical protein
MIEGVMRETLTPHQAAVTRIPERFWLLMDEYNLSSPEVAHLLADWNMSLGVLENRERTLGYMTPPCWKNCLNGFMSVPGGSRAKSSLRSGLPYFLTGSMHPGY